MVLVDDNIVTRNPLLTVIIPLYNCSSVIIRCLESIDFNDKEIVIVDDGSEDDSLRVVEEYSISHPGIRIIHKNNGGVSSARNVGIQNAKGKYIVFVDADDYLVPGGLDRVIQIAEEYNADVVKYTVRSLYNDSPIDGQSVADFPVSKQCIKGKGEALMRYDISDYHVIDGVFRTDLIRNNHIQFHTDLCLHEDDVFMGELYCKAEEVIITDLPLYRYIRYSKYSSTHNQPLEKKRQLIHSGVSAIKYRQVCIMENCPGALPLEYLKNMRYVCHPMTAIEAEYSLKEYKQILDLYRGLNCYPLDYKWITVSRMDVDKRRKLKLGIKTFLCNHPTFAYCLLKPLSAFNHKDAI